MGSTADDIIKATTTEKPTTHQPGSDWKRAGAGHRPQPCGKDQSRDDLYDTGHDLVDTPLMKFTDANTMLRYFC